MTLKSLQLQLIWEKKQLKEMFSIYNLIFLSYAKKEKTAPKKEKKRRERSLKKIVK